MAVRLEREGMSEMIHVMLDMVEWSKVDSVPPGDGLPYVTHQGVLRFGDLELRVYQLSNGLRVIDSGDMAALFGFESKEEFGQAMTELARQRHEGM